MTGSDVDIAAMQLRMAANAECDPLRDLGAQDMFNAAHALRQAADFVEAEGVRLLTASKAKGVGV